jgi:hypothetical protein
MRGVRIAPYPPFARGEGGVGRDPNSAGKRDGFVPGEEFPLGKEPEVVGQTGPFPAAPRDGFAPGRALPLFLTYGYTPKG